MVMKETTRWAEQPAEAIRLLTVPEAASCLGVSEAKGWQLVARGQLRSLKIDSSRRVSTEAIADYIREREQAEARQAGSAA
jgi:excisionase family DNA binding protein